MAFAAVAPLPGAAHGPSSLFLCHRSRLICSPLSAAPASSPRAPGSAPGFVRGIGKVRIFPVSPWQMASTRSDGEALTSKTRASVSYREAFDTKEECGRICQMVNDAYRKEGNWTNEVGVVAGERVTPERLRPVLKPAGAGAEEGSDSRKARMIVAVDKETGMVVGCVEAGMETETDGRVVGTVGMLSVDYRYGSRGIGGGLVREAERSVQKWWGCKVAQMWVVGCRDEILAWYTRLGYVDTKRRVEPTPLLSSIDNELLQDCDFWVLEKRL